MKRILIALIPLLLLLGACAPSTPLPETPTSPSAGEILTSVAETMAALPSQTPAVIYVTVEAPCITPTLTSTPTFTPSPSGTSTYTPIPPTPVIIYVYPTAPVYPTAVPAWSPWYADQFIYYYYQRINFREYTTAWSLLTEAFKAAVNPDGYAGFVNYWNTVARVDIRSVSVTSLAGTSANVLVDLVYTYFNGAVISSLQPFRLYYDAYRSTWMFDSLTVSVPTPAPVYLTPDQFIYYYFQQINLRNYPLTWSLLSASFIANNNPPSSGGYAGYVDYWNSVYRVDITSASVLSNNGLYADVSVGMKFTYNSGLVTTAYPTYHLLWNYSLGNWQFYSP